jgi:tellurite resistance protein TehA-like permease
MAFPLAMYTTSTFQLSKALDLPFLLVIPRVMVVVAIGAWMAVFIGFIHTQFVSFNNQFHFLRKK